MINSIFIKDKIDFNNKYEVFSQSTFEKNELEIFEKYIFYPIKDKQQRTTIVTTNENIISVVSRDIKAFKLLMRYYDKKQPLVILNESLYFQIIDFMVDTLDIDTIRSEKDALSLFTHILKDAARKNASDIHFIWTKDNVIVKYRIDGEIIKQKDKVYSHNVGETIRNICINKTGESEDEKNEVAGKFSEIIDHQEKEYRLSIGPSTQGYNIVIRAESKINKNTRLIDWGYSPRVIEIMEKFKNLPYGIVLVTGPTGSGKSTLLYTIANEIFQDSDKIIKTVEDPVEIHIDGIHQVQVNVKGHKEHWMTFEKAIKMFLRQDPDVIIVGEMRDREVANAALSAAKTGHLTFSTLHTNDVKSTISRLFDMEIEKIDIEDGLRGIVSQRLIPTLCDRCKIKVEDGNRVYYKRNVDGCDNCSTSKIAGYKGRIPIVEMALLNGEKDNYNFINFEDYYSMTENILYLLEIGKIDKEIASRYIDFNTNKELEKESEIISLWNEVIKNKENNKYISALYQPIVDNNKDVVSYEAFIRLKTLDNNILTPNEFIPLAKKLDIYDNLSIFFIKKIINDLIHIEKDIFINIDDYIVANIDNYLTVVTDELKKYHYLHHIILETSYNSKYINQYKKITDSGLKLCFHNCEFSISDIQYIIENKLNIEYLKTSKSFIDTLESDNFEISQNYINILDSLKSTIIISYIESKRDLDRLKKFNRPFLLQGYKLKEPLNIDKISKK